MAVMPDRRKLGLRGRVIAAAVSAGCAGALVGVMAVTDSTTGAASTPVGNDASASTPDGSSSATPYSPYSPYSPSQNAPSTGSQTPSVQPHTRSGGS
jgi:hypothetical protein